MFISYKCRWAFIAYSSWISLSCLNFIKAENITFWSVIQLFQVEDENFKELKNF